MNTLKYTLVAGVAACALTTMASADTIWHFDSSSSYTSAADSPFATAQSTGGFWMEDFEDGQLNSLGLSATDGSVRSPGTWTDSVDGDDGSIDGSGSSGYSFMGNGATGLSFSFDAASLGGLPTYAGLVWTDGNSEAMVTFEAFDSDGNLIGTIEQYLGDADSGQGQTGEDRFLGVQFDGGISEIRISSEFGGLEVDHVQYGYAVVPLPAPVMLGLAGLGGVAIMRRRRRNQAA